jgi:hypothetical protein
MDILAWMSWLFYSGGVVAAEASGARWYKIPFWPYYLGKKIGAWAVS